MSEVGADIDMAAVPTHIVAVRELCEFTAKRGDLDMRFTPSPSSKEGIAGHSVVAGRRKGDYQREVPLQLQHQSLLLRGRADGLTTAPPMVEEVKTHRGDLSRMPANHRDLHLAQLKLYGAMRCAEHGLDQIELRLTYFNIDSERETTLSETTSAEVLRAFLSEHCETYLQWHRQEQAHRETRNAALVTIAFPHAVFHGGQRKLSEAVYRAIATSKPLLAQAPTGIGKSIGTMFPALKAMGLGKLDKIFYLTAKTSGRQMALGALASLQPKEGVLPLRILEMVAREKSCEHPDKACHGDSCPLAKGFYDRLPAARGEAVLQGPLHQAVVRHVALAHSVCPYYLSQELTRWADVVVGDYNYYFDQSALLYGLTVLNEWKVAVLVDEAHNLVERGRAMYSGELSSESLRAARGLAPTNIKRAMTKLLGSWNRVVAAQAATYQTYPQPQESILDELRNTVGKIGDHLVEQPTKPLPELQRFYFDALNFLGLAVQVGEHSLFDVQVDTPSPTVIVHPGKGTSTLCIRNVVPGRFIKGRISAAVSVVGFSATLQPANFYRDLLGFDPSTPWLDVASPFGANQLEVKVVDSISTRFRNRSASARPIAKLIAEQYRQQPGNYLAFFSSYAYLDEVLQQVGIAHPEVVTFSQRRRMKETDQADFVSRFTEGSRGVGFAVLGGAFSEGIDLPGRRLVGAFVATLGLPQFNEVNEEMRKRTDQLFGAGMGYDFTYLFPGMRKVVQAAGRVIRTLDDRGVVTLIDDRFGDSEVNALLPSWWVAPAQ